MLLTLHRADAERAARTWPALAAALAVADPHAAVLTLNPSAPPPVRVPARPRLGDTLAGLFASLGFAASPSCGCARRQAWLNRNALRIELSLWAVVGLLILFRILA